MITIDGSRGEGGGQVLRTSLALSLATCTPFRIEKIRAGRSKPGLMRQHLTAVQAAAAVGSARVDGASTGSGALTFEPREVQNGEYTFSVGTAGSAMLVLQTVLPPLLLARGTSTLTLEGGTHNPWAPPFEFFERAFLSVVNRLGPRVDVRLDRAGFYPAGGGRLTATIHPAPVARLELVDRGEITGRGVRALVSNLPRQIAEREVRVALDSLNWPDAAGSVECIASAGPGNALMIEIASEHAVEVCTAFGEIGVRAEAVAGRAVDEARRYLSADVPVGSHLADQLLPILAIGAGGTFRTVGLSQHTRTNMDVLGEFLNLRCESRNQGRDIVRIHVNKG